MLCYIMKIVYAIAMTIGTAALSGLPVYPILHSSDGTAEIDPESHWVTRIPDTSNAGNDLWAQGKPGALDFFCSHARQTDGVDGDYTRTHSGGTGTMAAKIDLQRYQFCWQADIKFDTGDDGNGGIAPGEQYIFSTRSDQAGEGISLHVNPDGSLSAMNYGATKVTTPVGLVADNKWVHVAVSFEGAIDAGKTPPPATPDRVDAGRQIVEGNLRIYVNGVLKADSVAMHVVNNESFGPVLGQWRHDVGIAPLLCFDNIQISGDNAMGARRQQAFTDRTAKLMPTLANNMSSWGDINGDGFPDLFDIATTWINDGGKAVTAPTTALGGANILGDWNNDGRLDAFNYSVFRALSQNEDGSLSQLPLDGAALQSASLGACWGDFNGDSFLDVYVGGTMANHQVHPDRIFMNQGGERFTIAWEQKDGIRNTRGATACDFDMDNDLDVYASNYWLAPNFLWLNDGNASFTDVAQARGVQGDNPARPPAIQTYGHTISSAWGDFDNDGYFDLFQCNFNHHDGRRGQDATFYRNRGPEHGYSFEIKKILDGTDWQEAFASAVLGDYDNDGRLDVYICTAPGYPGSANRLFRNEGNWQFRDMTSREGLSGRQQTYQAGWADFDLDGDLDLVTAGKFFVNTGNANHWLEVRLEGNGTTVNRGAIGAKVRIDMGDGTTQIRQVEAGTGQASQNDMTLHFGMGARTESVSVQILWPDGTGQTMPGVSLDQVLTIAQGAR